MFEGCIVAVVTPFRHSRIDTAAFERYISWLLESNPAAIVVCGSTGEMVTLIDEEKKLLLEIASRVIDNKVPLIFGVGAPSTREVLSQAEVAEKNGANALLAVTPYYVKPNPEGIYQHYVALHNATNLPIVLYNNPYRTCVDMDFKTIERIIELPRFVALKEAASDVSRIVFWKQKLRKNFNFLAGNDGDFPAFLAYGGHGIISVGFNVAPRQYNDFYRCWNENNLNEAITKWEKLALLNKSLFLESNPAPVKYALSLLGLMRDEVRLPLVPIKEETKQQIIKAMQALGLIS